ncbi:unnamed protein product [Parascedosporium putredinis]|uniref:Uncharacterized protein n=1 Tax=Parascedosporium putredinis TaxID=1442378 RepID=A0A9P1HCQ3_9PEZI|nr:unnamed protein product [Parascedosporium putredinis]CAI8005019.1 unnamed protein product [Parascedosporium putredinis]
MKFSLGVLSILLATVAAQTEQVCTQELVKDVDCADVINPTACYNMFRFRNAQTLSCIEGTDNADRARKPGMDLYSTVALHIFYGQKAGVFFSVSACVMISILYYASIRVGSLTMDA